MNGVKELANAIMFTTYALYYVSELGFNPLQIVLIGTFLEIVVFALEIPTGVLADTYSRRLSVILAFFIMGFAYVLEGSVPFISSTMFSGILSFFVLVVAAEMIRGVGETFLSGAQQAWIADEVGEERLVRLFQRAGQIRQGAAIFGVIISVVLSSIAMNLPYVIGGILYLTLAVYLTVAMKETGFQPIPRGERSSWRSLKDTFQEGLTVLKTSRLLKLIMLIAKSRQ